MVGANQQAAPGDLSRLDDRADRVWSEQALRHVFENSPDAILIIQDGLFVDCNQASVEMFRSKGKDELCAASLSDLSPPVQPDGASSTTAASEMIARAVEQGSHRFEWLAKRHDHSEFPVEVLLTFIPFSDKQVLHSVWRDITRRKQPRPRNDCARRKTPGRAG
jgi:PAS domain S-box-containing protein